MMRRVLVTRPEPGASATANALRAAGFEPVIASLTEILALRVDGEFEIGAIDAIAATSANALRHAPEQLLARLAGLPLFAVGEATATAATAAGFRNVVSGPGDAPGLAALVQDGIAAGSTVLYLCGKVRRPEFEGAIESADLKIAMLETYDTRSRDPDAGFSRALAAGPPLFAVLLHSSEAAKTLAGLMSRPGVAEVFANAVAVAISARAAAPVQHGFVGRIRVAAEPTDAAMISTLKGAI